MVNFEDVLFQWQDYGLYTVVLPFLLVFILSFGVLEKVNMFGVGNKSRKINAILSVVLGLLFIQSSSLVFLLNSFLPNASMLLVVAVVFLVFFGLLTKKDLSMDTGFYVWAVGLMAFAAVVWALFYDSFSRSLDIPYWLYLSDQAQANILVIGAIILVIWLIVKPSGERPREDRPVTNHPTGGASG